MKKINMSKIAAHATVGGAFTIGLIISILCCFGIVKALVSVPTIYSMLNRSGGICLGFMIAILLATIFIPVSVMIKNKIINFIINMMEKKMKKKRA